MVYNMVYDNCNILQTYDVTVIAKNDEGEYVEKEENGVAYYQVGVNLNTKNACIPPFFQACQYILRAAKPYIRMQYKAMLKQYTRPGIMFIAIITDFLCFSY